MTSNPRGVRRKERKINLFFLSDFDIDMIIKKIKEDGKNFFPNLRIISHEETSKYNWECKIEIDEFLVKFSATYSKREINSLQIVFPDTADFPNFFENFKKLCVTKNGEEALFIVSLVQYNRRAEARKNFYFDTFRNHLKECFLLGVSIPFPKPKGEDIKIVRNIAYIESYNGVANIPGIGLEYPKFRYLSLLDELGIINEEEKRELEKLKNRWMEAVKRKEKGKDWDRIEKFCSLLAKYFPSLE